MRIIRAADLSSRQPSTVVMIHVFISWASCTFGISREPATRLITSMYWLYMCTIQGKGTYAGEQEKICEEKKRRGKTKDVSQVIAVNR